MDGVTARCLPLRPRRSGRGGSAVTACRGVAGRRGEPSRGRSRAARGRPRRDPGPHCIPGRRRSRAPRQRARRPRPDAARMNASWSQSGYAEIARLVRERTGLTFGGPRIAEVEGTIRRTMTQRGIGRLDDLAEQLRDDERLRESFIADLTIGESYFGRDPAQFELLRERILPQLLDSRPDDRPVRVWSAGCSAGEEPYTV